MPQKRRPLYLGRSTMTRKNTIRSNMLGLWIFGMIVGENLGELLPGGGSLPPWAMLVIGFVGSLGTSAALFKALR